MITIIDLGHKPRSSCYLIELDLYGDNNHKPLHIMVDAPIEISDILDFVPNEIYFNTKQQCNKPNWKLDESGKQWIIGNKPFKNSPFYFTVPFKKTVIQSNKDTQNPNNTNKKRKLFTNGNNNNTKIPSAFLQNKIFVDIILISNHESILGLPYLFKSKSKK
eukprot:56229_1